MQLKLGREKESSKVTGKFHLRNFIYSIFPYKKKTVNKNFNEELNEAKKDNTSKEVSW